MESTRLMAKLKEAQLKEELKRSKRENRGHQKNE
jgi:hypothetical protein